MNIIITRHRYSKYGVDGTLNINGQHVCDTCEHPDKYIPIGTYGILIKRNNELRRKVPYIQKTSPVEEVKNDVPFIKIGNGTFNLLDGSIIVGKCVLRGVIIHSAESFNTLIDRLDKAMIRREEITLTIQ